MTNLKSVKNSDKGALVTYTGDNGKEYNVIAHAKVTVDGVQHVFPANGTHEEQKAYFQLVADQAYANNVKMAERQANLTDEERAAQREAGLKGAAISKAKFDAMTDDEKAAYKEQQRKAGLKGAEISKAKFDAMTDEEKAEYAKKQREAGLRGAAIMKEKVAKMSPEQKAEYDNKQREAGLKGARISAEKRANMTPEELQQEREEQSRRGKAYWEGLSDEEREAHRNKSIAGNIQSALIVDEGFSL